MATTNEGLRPDLPVGVDRTSAAFDEVSGSRPHATDVVEPLPAAATHKRTASWPMSSRSRSRADADTTSTLAAQQLLEAHIDPARSNDDAPSPNSTSLSG
jgi:hypothetical protein